MTETEMTMSRNRNRISQDMKTETNRPLTFTNMRYKGELTPVQKRMQKRKYPTFIHEFTNLEHFINVIVGDSYENDRKSFDTQSYKRASGGYSDFERLFDIRSRQNLLKSFSNGYSGPQLWKYYQDKKQKIYANPDNAKKLGEMGVDSRRKRRADMSGSIINIDKYMGGEMPFESIRRNNQQRCIRIFIDYGQSCGELGTRLADKCCNAIAVATQLEKQGFATEISFGDVNCSTMSTNEFPPVKLSNGDFHAYNQKSISIIKFIAKPSGVPIDETNIINYAVPSMFRDLIFDFRRNCLGANSSIGRILCYEVSPKSNTKFYQDITESDIYIGHNDELHDIMSNVVGVIEKADNE